MGPGEFMCGTWWFIPMIFCGIMIIACLFVIGRRGICGGYRHGSYRCSCGGATGESPRDILKLRYARGEISKEELESLSKDLS
jgi:uncharacterized membrane protein